MRVFICARVIGRCVNRLYGIFDGRSTVAFYHLTDHSAENPEGYIIRTKFPERVSARKSVSRGAHARIRYSHYIYYNMIIIGMKYLLLLLLLSRVLYSVYASICVVGTIQCISVYTVCRCNVNR